MPIKNRFAEMLPEITGWRHHLHENPELLYEVRETAAFVADRLREFGVDAVVEGVGQTGVVGIIRGRGGVGARHRPARRYGRAADPRGDGATLCLKGGGQDACLRP